MINSIHFTLSQSTLNQPVVVLIHGAGGDLRDWPAALREHPTLAVLALDLPGHGRSAGDSPVTIDGYSQFIDWFIKDVGLEHVILAGHSMGGAIVQTVAQQRPPWLNGVILCNTGARMPVNPQILHDTLHDLPAYVTFFSRFAWAKDAPNAVKEDKAADLLHQNPHTLHDDFSACAAFDMGDRLTEIRVPALVIGGEKDKFTPPADSEFLAQHIPTAALHILSGRGHMLPLEAPDELVSLVEKFVSALRR